MDNLQLTNNLRLTIFSILEERHLQHSQLLSRFIILLLISLWLAGCGSPSGSPSGSSSDSDDAGNSDGGSITPPTPGDVLYDLLETDTQNRGPIPFAVNWPIMPTTTQTLNVPSDVSLATAAATPGAVINVAAGSYGMLYITNNDQHWILDDNAVFSEISGSGFSRVIIEGGQVDNPAANCVFEGYTDLLVANVNFNVFQVNAAFGTNGNFQRSAWIHNTIVAGGYGIFTPGAQANDAGVWSSDLILAANYITGGGGSNALRLQSIIRTIMVDNRVRTGQDGGSTRFTVRSHYGNQDFWMRRNLSEYGPGIYFQTRLDPSPMNPNNYMGNHWVYDFDFYTTSDGTYGFRGTHAGEIFSITWPGAITTDGNNGYGNNTSPNPWIWFAQAGDSLGTETSNAYQAPPALNSWLAANGLPPGADH